MEGVNIYNYLGSRKVLNEQIEQTAKYMTSSYVQKLEHHFVDKEAIINSAAKSLEDDNISEVAMIDFFKNLKSSSNGIVNVFAGFESGKYIEANGWSPSADYKLRTREWYQKSLSSDGIIYTDIYEDKGTHQLIVSIVKRIERKGIPVGAVGLDVNLDEVKKLTDEIKFGKSGYGYVIDNKGNFICHPTLQPSDNIFMINNGEYKDAAKDFLSGKPIQQNLTFKGVERYDSSMPIGKTGWTLVIDTPLSELYEGITKLGQISVMSTILGLLILCICIFILANKISKPISNLSVLADKVAKGDLTADMSSLQKSVANDEVGQLTRSFYIMTKNIIKIIEQLKEGAQELNNDSQKLTRAATSASEIMQMIYESIEEISLRMETVSASTREISVSSEEVTASLHQLNDQVENENNLAKKIEQHVKVLGQETEKAHVMNCKMSQDILQRVKQAIEKTKIVEEIASLTKEISGMTGQAKILALIAESTAEREDGSSKGVAAVVTELRETTLETAETVNNIKGMTKQVQQSSLDLINTSSELVKLVGESIAHDFDKFSGVREQYSSDVSGIFMLNQELLKMCNQVLITVGNVNREIELVAAIIAENVLSTQEITKGTQYTAKSVMEISEAANSLSQMAENHNKIVNQFKIS
jgi:methyl-accepting chemotaxis protein